jgi:hypothetical protein
VQSVQDKSIKINDINSKNNNTDNLSIIIEDFTEIYLLIKSNFI